MRLKYLAPLILGSGLSLTAAVTPPQWVLDAAKTPAVTHAPDIAGDVLLDETRVIVERDGTIRSHHRRVLRILNTAGRELGVAAVPTDKETKVSDFRGWTIPPKGAAFEVRDRDVIETSAFDGELYGDQKIRILRLPAAEPGNVIAYEYDRRERPYALQQEWSFQGELPVEKATLMVELPEGWKREVHWINSSSVEPVVSGSSATWNLTSITPIKAEPGMLAIRAMASRLAINFIPPAENQRVHTSWNDVGAWYSALIDGRRDASDELKKKAAALTAGTTDAMERLRRISRFVQSDVRYVAIEIGIGGFQPHRATEIFRNRYGDCKDKVTVLGSMLDELGIESYYLLVHTDRGVVQRDFATHATFNHAIAAIRLPEGTALAGLQSIVRHPKLGNLLIFDPTNDLTPLGALPDYLQDSDALLVTAGGGELIHLPIAKPDQNRIDVTAKMTLETDGLLHGNVREVRTGWIAARYRSALRALNESDRRKLLERYLASHFSNFTVDEAKFENVEQIDRDLVVSYSIAAPAYAKNAGSMILIRPRVVGRKAEGVLDLKERKYGYELDAPSTESDSVTITLPAAWKIDELPAEQKINLPQLSYASRSSQADGVLTYKREYKVNSTAVPREQLESLNAAFRQILTDERNSAVAIPAH
jgi:hypothetical protein